MHGDVRFVILVPLVFEVKQRYVSMLVLSWTREFGKRQMDANGFELYFDDWD